MKKEQVQLCSIVLIFLFALPTISPISTAIDEPIQITRPSSMNWTILYVGGSGPGNYSTIQDAVDNASEGDLVFVYSGFYQENIQIHTSISLYGIQETTTIIDGGWSGTVVTISASHTMITGFTIQHAKDDVHSAGIEISNADNVIIEHNVIQDNGMLGISLKGPDATETMIYRNIIRNNSFGVYLFNAPSTLVMGNNISDNQEGVYVVGSYDSTIGYNNVTNRGLGIHIENAFDLIVFFNNVFSNSQGVFMINSSEVSIIGNTIGRNRWYGLWLKKCSNNIVSNNTISSNIDVGLFLESSFDTSVTNNAFWDNDNGVYLKDSAGNSIQYNNLRNYKMNGCFVAHTLIHRRNIWRQNYWERPRMMPYPILGCIKLEKITISCMNIDWTPLVHPSQTNQPKNLKSYSSILYVGGTGPNNYTSIQDAIEDAHNNDTVYVFNGTYYEAVLIDKPLTLVGENKKTTILEGNGTRDIITITADDVHVRGFSIVNGHFNILVNHSAYANISGNIIFSGLHGVSVQNGCRFITISWNSLQENVYGVRIFSSTDTMISENTFNSFKINAFYYGTTLAHGRQHWYHNYWGKPRFLPNIIPGKIRMGNVSLTWLNVDWFPLQNPSIEILQKTINTMEEI